jgi:hypothetical protein
MNGRSAVRRRGRGDLKWMLAELQRTDRLIGDIEQKKRAQRLTEREVVDMQRLQQRRAALQGFVDALAQED